MSLGVNTTLVQVRADLPSTDMTEIHEKSICAVFIFTILSGFTGITNRTNAKDVPPFPLRACIRTIGRGYLPVA